jgi:hypothetical protein
MEHTEPTQLYDPSGSQQGDSQYTFRVPASEGQTFICPSSNFIPTQHYTYEPPQSTPQDVIQAAQQANDPVVAHLTAHMQGGLTCEHDLLYSQLKKGVKLGKHSSCDIVIFHSGSALEDYHCTLKLVGDRCKVREKMQLYWCDSFTEWTMGGLVDIALNLMMI